MEATTNSGSLSRPPMGPWRQRLWPIYTDEIKRFMLLVLILLGALTSYTLLRNMKDAILINAPGSGKDVLPWVKMAFVTPASILFVLIYAKLSNIFSKEKLFAVVLFGFLAFFLFFSMVLYPLNNYFNASLSTIEGWQKNVPMLGNFLTAIGYWTYTLFYVMSELWGNVAVSILFWQFANQIVPTFQAKRFYPVFSLFSNIGLLVAGQLLLHSKAFTSFIFDIAYPGKGATSEALNQFYIKQTQFLCGFAVLMGLLMYACFVAINSSFEKNTEEKKDEKSKKTKKPKLSMGESFSLLMKSSYLGYITILVLAFNIIINLVEISWKGVIKEYFEGNMSEYMAFQGHQYTYLAISTALLILFCQNFTRVAGWRFTANIAPIVNLVTGGLFFAFMIYRSLNGNPSDYTLAMAMYIGLANNLLGKGTKYAFFDPTKEMAYIPLDEDSKVKGKAAIDVIGGRAGKGGGSTINIIFSSILGKGTPFFIAVGGIMTFIALSWVWAVNRLAVLYEQKTKEKENNEKNQ